MPIDKSEIEEFLFHEADLLDDGRLQDWLKLFDKDGVYWIPLDPHSDPVREPSVLYDDAGMRAMRVYQMVEQESHWSQIPPSRTIHSLSNIRVGPQQSDGSVEVRCNLIVTELRSAGPRSIQYGLGSQRSVAGRCLYRLVRGDSGWSIALKKVTLINYDQPLDNLTFIV